MLHIFVDADACPVKQETYRVAGRYGLEVTLVANSWIETPVEDWIHLEVVRDGFDAADEWIIERVSKDDIVVTADVPLASRAVAQGAEVTSPSGRRFTEENIGDALATRDLLTELRIGGQRTSGPPPFSRRDRSQFLQTLDQLIQAVRKRHGLN